MQKFTLVKTFSCFLVFIFSIGMRSGYAQDIIAKIKYEEAEAAFEKEDYQTAITRIEEVEAILKKSSPKTLYLKILAQSKLSEPSYSVIQSLKNNCNYYLNNYSQVEGIEEKFREIYKVSESIKKYPQFEFEYTSWLAARQKEQAEKEAENKKRIQVQYFLEKFKDRETSIYGIKLGMNFSEVPYSTWNYLERYKEYSWEKGKSYESWTLNRNSIIYIPKSRNYKPIHSDGLRGLWLDANTRKVIFLVNYLVFVKNSSIDAVKSKYEALSKNLKDEFGKENVEENEHTETNYGFSFYSKTIKLSQNSPIIISYSLWFGKYVKDDLVGDVYLVETLSLPDLTDK